MLKKPENIFSSKKRQQNLNKININSRDARKNETKKKIKKDKKISSINFKIHLNSKIISIESIF